MSADRQVTQAVNEVLALAPRRGEVSLARLVAAVGANRSRPIEVTAAELPAGVSGQWRQFADHDEFLIQEGLPTVDRTLAHELALQIAASSPQYIREEDVPNDVVEHEKKIAEARAREEGKPENILPRIVEGAMKKYLDEVVLLRQPYIRDESISVQQLVNQTVASLGENVVIRRFARWALGESTEVE